MKIISFLVLALSVATLSSPSFKVEITRVKTEVISLASYPGGGMRNPMGGLNASYPGGGMRNPMGGLNASYPGGGMRNPMGGLQNRT